MVLLETQAARGSQPEPLAGFARAQAFCRGFLFTNQVWAMSLIGRLLQRLTTRPFAGRLEGMDRAIAGDGLDQPAPGTSSATLASTSYVAPSEARNER